jgi:hypothetical protein
LIFAPGGACLNGKGKKGKREKETKWLCLLWRTGERVRDDREKHEGVVNAGRKAYPGWLTMQHALFQYLQTTEPGSAARINNCADESVTSILL